MVVNCSGPLVWEVIRKTNCYAGKKTRGPYQFSKEKLNVQNLHGYKWSPSVSKSYMTVEKEGDFNLKVVGLKKNDKGKYEAAVEKELKDGAGPKRNNKKVLEVVDNNYIRKDLKKAVCGRYTKMFRSTQKARKARA